jgi:hypothetical protein
MVLEFGNPNLDRRCSAGSVWLGARVEHAPARWLWRTDTTNQRGGSEWEPIKILLEWDESSNKTNTAYNTRLRLTTQVGQVHAATGVLMDLGTNKQPSEAKHTNTLLTQNRHLTPSTQQAERSWLNTRDWILKACQSIFLKLTKEIK